MNNHYKRVIKAKISMIWYKYITVFDGNLELLGVINNQIEVPVIYTYCNMIWCVFISHELKPWVCMKWHWAGVNKTSKSTHTLSNNSHIQNTYSNSSIHGITVVEDANLSNWKPKPHNWHPGAYTNHRFSLWVSCMLTVF